MYKKIHINIINTGFFLLLFLLFIIILTSVTHSNIINENIKYTIGIALSIFFGPTMKSIYETLFNLHFNFSEDIPNEILNKKKHIKIAIDVFSIASTFFLLGLFTSSGILITGLIIFIVILFVLGIYSIFTCEEIK